MSIAGLAVVTTIALALLTALVSLIGFLGGRALRQIDGHLDDLGRSVATLAIAVEVLRTDRKYDEGEIANSASQIGALVDRVRDLEEKLRVLGRVNLEGDDA